MAMVDIVETSFVVPSEETPKHKIWLSNIDQRSRRDYTPTVYVYRPNAELSLYSTADALKVALSKALVPFYPMAGRLELDSDGRCEIDCTGDGVLFVTARSEGSVDEFGDFAPSPEMRRVLVPSVESAEPPGAILTMMQVTFFKCGAVTLGVATHHIAVDGHSALHFINTWAGIARGITDYLPIKPYFDRSLLHARSPPTVSFDHIEYKPNSNPSSTPSVSAILKLSRTQVSHLKNLGNKNNYTKHLSTFRAITAHVWRCVCIARKLDANQKTRLYVTVNVRHRLSPPLPLGFFGNANYITSAVAAAGEIVSNSLDFSAEMIRDAIDRVNEENVRSLIDYMEMERSARRYGPQSCDLLVISWLGMPVHSGDFGWGKPEFMGRASSTQGGFVYLVQSPEEEGGVYVPLTLETEVMESFKKVFYKEMELLNGSNNLI